MDSNDDDLLSCQSEIFCEVYSKVDSEFFYEVKYDSEKDFILSLQTQLNETVLNWFYNFQITNIVL